MLGLGDRERNTPASSRAASSNASPSRARSSTHPSLLLADEPTGNLDTRNSHEIMDTLSSLNRERGVTIVLVTHEPDIAAYADRIVTMRDGKIVSDERKHEEKRPPQIASNLMAARGESVPSALEATRPTRVPSGAFWAFGSMIAAAATQAIARNKMRSALTMLGVFIGVAALIAMVAVGQGANEAVRKQIQSLGTNCWSSFPAPPRRAASAPAWAAPARSPSPTRKRCGATICRREHQLPHPAAGTG